MYGNKPQFYELTCTKHNQPIKFVCQGDTCHFKPLCLKCAEEHDSEKHFSHKIHIDQAMVNAYMHMEKQKKIIDSIVAPFNKKSQFSIRLREQETALEKERARLFQQINDLIDGELRELKNKNNVRLNDDVQFVKQLKKKQQQIQDLLNKCTKDGKSLQYALNFQLQEFIQSMNINTLNLNTHFHYYPNTKHHMQIGKLQLMSQAIAKKPLKTVMNESPLYFLIDKNIPSSPQLATFVCEEKIMKTYNVENDSWNHFLSDVPIYPDGCQVHDHLTDRFFWIGGNKDNRTKSSSIVIIDASKNSSHQLNIKMGTGRSSCMATIVTSENKKERGILIVGGIGSNGEILKSCEYFNLKNLDQFIKGNIFQMKTEAFGNTNFGCFAGTLATFNGDTVLRLGGLAKKNNSEYSVIEIVEKLNLRSYFDSKSPPRWSYIEFQIPKRDKNYTPRLFYANQAAVQINPQQIFVFGGNSAGWKGVTESYLISVEEYTVQGRFGRNLPVEQQKFIVRWVNEKPLITGDHFAGLRPIIWNGKVYSFQNISEGDGSKKDNKRLIEFDMYNWWQTPNVIEG